MQTPNQIRRFAACAVLACLLNAGATMALTHFAPRAVGWSSAGAAILCAAIACVVLARSPIARMIVTIWLAFVTGSGLASYGMLIAIHRLSSLGPAIHAASVITILANIAALCFLWSAAATAWLQRRDDLA